MCFGCGEKSIAVFIALIFLYNYINSLKYFNFKELSKIQYIHYSSTTAIEFMLCFVSLPSNGAQEYKWNW